MVLASPPFLRALPSGFVTAEVHPGLMADMYGNLIKDDNTEGVIEIDVRRGKQERRITTRVERSGEHSNLEVLKKDPKTFPWGEIFVCGYGRNSSHAGN